MFELCALCSYAAEKSRQEQGVSIGIQKKTTKAKGMGEANGVRNAQHEVVKYVRRTKERVKRSVPAILL